VVDLRESMEKGKEALEKAADAGTTLGEEGP